MRGQTVGDTDMIQWLAAHMRHITAATLAGDRVLDDTESAHRGHLAIGRIPVLYDDEVIGYLYMEDDWCNFELPDVEVER